MTAVLTALGARWDGHLVSRLESVPGMSIARRCADLADLVATAASGVGDVAFVGADLRGLTLSEVARLHDHGVQVIGVVEPGDEAGERRLWQLGVATVLSADSDGPTLAAVVQEYAVPRQNRAPALSGGTGPMGDGSHGTGERVTDGPTGDATPRHTRGRVLAVWGPTGAPGRTSIAVNLAAELAGMGREVVLIDADTYGGSVAQTLSILDEAPGVAAAARAADQGALDLVALSRLALVVTGTFRVLTGIPVASRWPEIRGAALERVIEVARWLADDVVIDCGFSVEDDEELSYDTQAPRRNQATLAALGAADELIVVGACDPVALQRLVRALQDLGSVRAPRPIVVVNRLRPGPVGSPPERHIGDALARFAGVPDPAFIPDDQVAFDLAMLEGRTLHECPPASRARAAMAALAARTLGHGAHEVGMSADGPTTGISRRRRGSTRRGR